VTLVVSDTSPVRALNHLGLLNVLEQLYGGVFIPTAVADELEFPAHDFVAIEISKNSTFHIRDVIDRERLREIRTTIDAGEAEAIALALEINADFLLIDELAGRTVAEEMGLRYIGVLGVLLRAKNFRLIDSVCPLMDKLQYQLNFFISPTLYEQVRRLAGES
jgi:uncharacterized protein